MHLYRPTYAGSHALVIGINRYTRANPLRFAVSDAEAVAAALRDQFGFPQENITLLVDADATFESIRSSLLKLAGDATAPDDRVLFFYAGHGHTQTGNRGEIGHLIPVDGAADDLASLLRWDELIRVAELIKAKHTLFMIDACYGGLAIRRGLAPGSSRLLRDMLTRSARQILTSGKADQQVSDGGGPRPDHSVFTGHLLDALAGGAAMEGGAITANSVMSYVYQRVSCDYESAQTPHFGFLDGDGDFLFTDPPAADESGERGLDTMVEIPAVSALGPKAPADFVARVKQCIADPMRLIELDDLLTAETRRVLQFFGDDRFDTNRPVASAEIVGGTLAEYEAATKPLRGALAALGHWSTPEHIPLVKKILTRVAEQPERQSGNRPLLGLQYYPALLCLYALGIAALTADRYDLLAQSMTVEVTPRTEHDRSLPLVALLGRKTSDCPSLFKSLPGHERQFTPLSEYLHGLLQPELDDLLFLGRAYDHHFDSFEILLALAYMDLADSSWAPVGRFGWKFKSGFGGHDPYSSFVANAESAGVKWPPLRAGLFGSTVDRFVRAKDRLRPLLERLPWY